MAIKMDAMQKFSSTEEPEIPEGKVNQICRQFLVHEDSGFAHRLQNEEINSHLNHNKIRNQIQREDLLQAKHIQQTEQQKQQVYQQLRKQKQALLDEQLAKELQLNLIEEEQKQMLEQQRIVEEDEKFAKNLIEKEKQKRQRRRLAREQAQIEKIKRERLKFYLDNNIDVSSTMNDDLDELDLSDFCRKPPDQMTPDQLTIFMNEQDEELARFLTIYEDQKKSTIIKDQQQLIENADYQIARLIYEEEKAKVRRLKEKRLERQRIKQQARNQLINDQETINKQNNQENDQQEYYIPDNRLYRLPNQNNEQFNNEQFNDEQLNYLNEEELYDEPPNEFTDLEERTNQMNCDNLNEEETDLKYLDNRPNSSNSLRYNAQNEDNAQYTLSTKNKLNTNNLFIKNRELPPLPNQQTFHNIVMDIDPTISNRKFKKEQNLINDNLDNSTNEIQLNENDLIKNEGVHFAQIARVEEDDLKYNEQNEYHLIEQHKKQIQNCIISNRNLENQIEQFNNQTLNGQINYVLHNQQMNKNLSNYMPIIQNQKRIPSSVNQQKKTKKEKSKDKCRQQ